ncbi:unnamed protein product, partial [Hymenolepis diminuta]
FLFILLIVAVSVAIGISLFGFSVVLGEGCTYVMKETAYKKTDYILNGFGADYWDALLMDYSDKLLNKSLVPAPKNIIEALSKVCKTDNGSIDKSLLFAVGYRDTSINFKTLIDSQQADKIVTDFWNKAMRQINIADIVSKFNNSDILSKLRDVLDEFSKNFDTDLPYDHLLLADVDFQPFVQWRRNLESYNVSLVENEIQNLIDKLKTNKQNLEHIFSQIKAKKEEILKVINDAILALTEIFSSISDKKKLDIKFKGMFDRAVLSTKSWFAQQAKVYLGELIKKVIPCGEAHKAFYVATEATCGENGLLHRVTALIYIVGINFFCLTLLALIFLLLNTLNIIKK